MGARFQSGVAVGVMESEESPGNASGEKLRDVIEALAKMPSQSCPRKRRGVRAVTPPKTQANTGG
jgi:hypothetical protein